MNVLTYDTKSFYNVSIMEPQESRKSRRDAWQPIDRADWLGDLLYVPEALYCIGLTVVMLAGPGPWSLDATIAALLAG